ncbi:MAG: replication protein, partial [Armatimonadetes bacterium]|nr:replication protein [Armatimonadota bacterium]
MKRPKAGRPALPDRWFPGFSSPNFTSVPDEVFDLLLSVLTEAELKVLLYIIRRTFGFKKSADSISIRQMTRGIRTATGQQLDSGTGLSVPSVTKAVKSLERQGIIVAIRSSSKERGSETTTYALNLRPAANPDLKLLRPSSKNTLDPPLNSLDPQDSGLQKTEEQQPHATASPVAVSSSPSPTKPSSTKQHRA